MARDPRHDILFEPLAIGPITAKNRFHQVPHCEGGGYRDASAAAVLRGIQGPGPAPPVRVHLDALGEAV